MLKVTIDEANKSTTFECPYCENQATKTPRKFCLWCSNEIGGIYNLHNDSSKRIKYYTNRGRI